MACDDGQEEHLLGLGRMLDGKIDTLRAAFGEIGDMRLAVMGGNHDAGRGQRAPGRRRHQRYGDAARAPRRQPVETVLSASLDASCVATG
jgi:cell division protein ZapA